MNTLCDLLVSFAEVFAAMSPWLVVGFLAAGVIAVWIPRAWVNRVMGGGRKARLDCRALRRLHDVFDILEGVARPCAVWSLGRIRRLCAR